MDRFDDDTLLAELRELRPTPRPEFTAELDERAAAGFPRRDSRAGAGRLAQLAAHLGDLRGKSARQWLIPVIGTAIAVVAVAIVVVAVAGNGGSSSSELMTSATSEGAGGGAEATSESAEARPFSKAAPPPTHSKKAEKAAETAAPEEAEGTVHGGEESVESEP